MCLVLIHTFLILQILYSRYFVRLYIYELKFDNIPVWGDSLSLVKIDK